MKDLAKGDIINLGTSKDNRKIILINRVISRKKDVDFNVYPKIYNIHGCVVFG